MLTRPKQVIQSGLSSVRCGNCAALLCNAAVGSVISIVCSRCKTHNMAEIIKPEEDHELLRELLSEIRIKNNT